MDPIETAFQHVKHNFNKCTSNLKRVNLLLNHNKQWEIYRQASFESPKDDTKSTLIRDLGNTQFKQKKYVKAIETYTSAIALAKNKRVAALAYSNRSAVLSKVGLYDESLIDIERAFDCDYPKETAHKLKSRRSDIIKKQNSGCTKQPLLSYPYRQQHVTESDNASILTQKNDELGRHIIATRDIEISEVVLVDKPYAVVLKQDNYIYCSECLNVCYNLIPCDWCIKTLYCSDTCKLQASKTHKYECHFLDTLERLESIKDSLTLALRVTLLILIELRKNGNSHYIDEIKKMEAHTDSRSLRMLFAISYISSIVYVLLKQHTSLFKDLEDSEKLFKELLPLCIQVVHINGVLINRLEPKVQGYETITYANGLYFLYSLFNHSCYPNVFFYHEGSRLVVKALGTIRKGQQCCISYRYTYSTTSKPIRQIELKEKFYFTCTCKACTENWPEESEDEDTSEFDEPFALVMMAQLKHDHDLLTTIGPTFARRLKSIEKKGPVKGLTCLRQLVVDCYHVYESPRSIIKEK